MAKAKDLTGKRFGKLLVLCECEPVIQNGKKYKAWRCKCDCGNEIVMKQGSLSKSNKSKSCGCDKHTSSESKEDKDAFEVLYYYVKTDVFGYDSFQALPSKFVMRLKGLKRGKYYHNNKIANHANYPYEVILLTFRACKSKIDYAKQTKNFNSEEQMFNYIMKIVEGNLNDIYSKYKARKESEKTLAKKEENVISVDQNVNITQKREDKKKNKFDYLW